MKAAQKQLSGPGTIAQVVVHTSGQMAYVDMYCLLGYALHRSKEFLMSHPEYVLCGDEEEKWENYKKRRLAGEPCSYITGQKEFYSLSFLVNPHTLIPRPESEMLVEEAINLAPNTLLDVGTGSGNIAVAVKHHLPACRVMAVDVSKGAVATAEKNARRVLGTDNMGGIKFIHSNFFSNVPPVKFEVIVSNPPYVKTSHLKGLQKEISKYEPRQALDGGEDGLFAYRCILEQARKYLHPHGRLLLEIDPDAEQQIIFMAVNNCYNIIKVKKDLMNKSRMVELANNSH
ncbi:MAG: peptide chain release factor N(5)-glutamine methyltransferase [Spirochaetota bacterium]